MVLYTVYNGFAQVGQEALVLDPCSDYAACMSSQDVQATVTIRPVFGQNPVFSQTYQCTQGYQRIQAPSSEGIYIVDVNYELNGTNVGRDRVLLPVAQSISEYSPPIRDARAAMIIGVDKVSGLGVIVPVKRGDSVSIPTSGRFDAYALYKRSYSYGCVVFKDGSSTCGYAARVRHVIRFSSVDELVNTLISMVSVYEPELQLWTCDLRGADVDTVVSALLPFLALRYAILGGIVIGFEADTANNEVAIDTVMVLGNWGTWLAFAAALAGGCVAGAVAGVWFAGVGALAGCIAGAAISGAAYATYLYTTMTSRDVEKVYNEGIANINAAANKALTDLENLYKQGYVSNKAYNVLKRDIENLRNIALEQLKLLKDALEHVTLEKKLMYAALGAIGGIALSALLRR